MTVYALRGLHNVENCYAVLEFSTREEAIKGLDDYHNYRFIEGIELILQLTEKE